MTHGTTRGHRWLGTLSISLMALVSCGQSERSDVWLDGQAAFGSSPPAILFEDVSAGETIERVIEITSTGQTTLVVHDVRLEEGSSSAFEIMGLRNSAGQAMTPPLLLQPTASATVRVRYDVDLDKTARGAVLIATNATPPPAILRVPLTSRRGSAAMAHIEPRELLFGYAVPGDKIPLETTITAVGDASGVVTIEDVAVGNPTGGAFRLEPSVSLPFDLFTGESLQVLAIFEPAAGEVQRFEDVLVVKTSNPAAPVTTASMLGYTGVFGQVRTSPEALEFGDVHTEEPSERELFVYNSGEIDVSIERIRVKQGGAVWALDAPPTPLTLSAMAKLALSVEFNPARSGLHEAEIEIVHEYPDDDGGTRTVLVPVSGTGVRPVTSITPLDVDLRAVTVGSMAEANVVVHNLGVGRLSVDRVHVSDEEGVFGLLPLTLPASLEDGDFMHVGLYALAGEPGVFTGQMTIATSDPFAEEVTVQLRAEVECLPGWKVCDGVCVDVSSNRDHCGACDRACSSGMLCEAGECRVSCQPGLTECLGWCRDLETDRNHCGACGSQCPDGFVCVGGECELACQDGLTVCGEWCRDLLTDPNHCGRCDAACEPGTRCVGGECL